MKKLFLVLFLTPIGAFSSEAFVLKKPVVCTELKSLVNVLKEEHQEIPLMLGVDQENKTKYSLFVNNKTKTWTFIQFDTETACILGHGIESRVILGERL